MSEKKIHYQRKQKTSPMTISFREFLKGTDHQSYGQFSIKTFNSSCFPHTGAVFAGGFSAGVYTTNSPEACRHLADNCEAQIIVVEDVDCLNKFLAVKRFLPSIKVGSHIFLYELYTFIFSKRERESIHLLHLIYPKDC